MTTAEMNVELFRQLSYIADDETMVQKVIKYIKGLTVKKKDPTLMTESEFFARIEEAEREIAEGKGVMMLPNESLDEFLKRIA